MSDIPGLLKRAAEAVAAVFSAFGGFVLNAQPPEGVLKGFTIGFASTLSALLFLIISVFSQRFASDRYRQIFTALATLMIIASAVAGFRYQDMFSALTLDIPSANKTEKIIIGADLTKEAKDGLAQTHEPLPQLLLDFGGKNARERVWPRDSIRAAILKLSNGYITLAVSIAAAVFCVAEALFPTKPSSKPLAPQE